jgi:hypothetical protein
MASEQSMAEHVIVLGHAPPGVFPS